MSHDGSNELVTALREKLRKCVAAREPDDWPIVLKKSELRLLLDAVDDHDDERLHLLQAAHALDGNY